MAVMSRKKKAVAQGWNAINQQRAKDSSREMKQEEISEEEHQERIKLLKSLGLVK